MSDVAHGIPTVDLMAKSRAATEIKAELYDIQLHNCNGGLHVGADNTTESGCSRCARIWELQGKLRELTEDSNA